MIFKLTNCDFGIKYNGVNYDFDHVDDLTIENPEFKRLTRGANAKDTEGLVFSEGMKEPKRWTVTIINMSAALKGVLDEAYGNTSRMDVYCVDRTDGSSKMAKNAILCQAPQQLSIAEGPETMNVALIFETFGSAENHKS